MSRFWAPPILSSSKTTTTAKKYKKGNFQRHEQGRISFTCFNLFEHIHYSNAGHLNPRLRFTKLYYHSFLFCQKLCVTKCSKLHLLIQQYCKVAKFNLFEHFIKQTVFDTFLYLIRLVFQNKFCFCFLNKICISKIFRQIANGSEQRRKGFEE